MSRDDQDFAEQLRKETDAKLRRFQREQLEAQIAQWVVAVLYALVAYALGWVSAYFHFNPVL